MIFLYAWLIGGVVSVALQIAFDSYEGLFIKQSYRTARPNTKPTVWYYTEPKRDWAGITFLIAFDFLLWPLQLLFWGWMWLHDLSDRALARIWGA